MTHPLIGVWLVEVDDATRSHVLHGFHADGTVLVTSAFHAAQGTWRPTGDRTAYVVVLRPIESDDRSFVGWQAAEGVVEIAEDGETYELSGSISRPTPGGSSEERPITVRGARLRPDAGRSPSSAPRSLLSHHASRPRHPEVNPMTADPDGSDIHDTPADVTLRASVAGRVITPADADYDEARAVWNGMIDKRPACIVQAASTGDIAPVIAFARARGLRLAIRGGGHNVAGNGTVDGGVVLDLGGLDTVEVDPAARLVRTGPGAKLGDIDRATEPHGLAVPVGVVSGTGIAGLTLGGGVGWLVRKHGLTIDNLVSAEVVLANGELVTASETEHPDLFWGLRGGGGNFGVVSSFTFRAHPLDQDVFAGTLVYERPRWREALASFAALAPELPDDLSVLMTVLVPPVEWELGDRVLLLMGFAWAGPDRAEGEAVVRRLREGCAPDVTLLDPVRWRVFQSAFDAALAKGSRAYWRNASFDRLDGPMLDTLVEWCGRQTYGTAVDLHHMGGAFGRVPADATAYPSRAAAYLLNIYGFWSDPAEDAARTAWVKEFSAAMDRHALAGQYVNFLGHDEADPRAKALAAYGTAKYERLVAVKRRYDPENLFRVNHNIPPGDAGRRS